MIIRKVKQLIQWLWIWPLLNLDKLAFGYTPNWYSILQPPPPTPDEAFQNIISKTPRLVPFSQFHKSRAGPIVKVLPEALPVLSPPQDVQRLPPEIRQVFMNTVAKKETEDMYQCSSEACAVKYRPICDNMGQVYQNPCWFGYHQCTKRREGIIIMAAGCDTLGSLEMQASRREPRKSTPVTLREQSSSCGDETVLGARLTRLLSSTFDQFAQNSSRNFYLPYTADSRIVMDRMPLILGIQSITNLYDAMISSGITSVQHKKLTFRCSEGLGVLETMFRVGRFEAADQPFDSHNETPQFLDKIVHAGSQVTVWQRQKTSSDWKIIMEYRIRHGK